MPTLVPDKNQPPTTAADPVARDEAKEAADAADLAQRFGDATRRAVHLHRAADLADPTAPGYARAQLDAADAALAAGRHNAARMLAARIISRSGDAPQGSLAAGRRDKSISDSDLEAARRIEREARDGLRDGARVRERTARIFVNEWAVKLRAVIEAGGARLLDTFLVGVPDEINLSEQARMPVRKEGQICPLDLVNFVLMHLAGGVGVTLVADGDGHVVQTAFTPHAASPNAGHDIDSLAAKLDAGGGAAPCPACGCPRFLFVQDDEAGEACPCCSWPRSPSADPVTRQRARAEELERQLADVVRERDGFKAQAETLTNLKGELEGKLAKYDRELRRAKAGAASTDAGAPMGVDLAQRVDEIERRLGIKILDTGDQPIPG